MKHILTFLLFSAFLLSSCIKNKNNNNFEEYFKFKLNGKAKSIPKQNSNFDPLQFDCDIQGDTVLYLVAGSGETIIFFIKAFTICNCTYQLDSKNKAFYSYLTGSNYKTYQTTDYQTGTITIKKGVAPLPAGTANTLEGTFSFKAKDTLSGETIEITEGKFLMERRDL